MGRIVQEGHERPRYYRWDETKERFKAKCCQICLSEEYLVLHHTRYYKYFSDDNTNLITLCRRCHYYIHFKNNGKKAKPEKWEKRMHKLMWLKETRGFVWEEKMAFQQ